MKHGSESRELIDGVPRQRYAGTSRSQYDNSICWLCKLSSFLIRVPSVFHPWLRNPFLTLRRLLDFPLEFPVGADALPRNNVRLFPPRVNKGSCALTGYEFPQHCERTTVRSRRKKEELIARSFPNQCLCGFWWVAPTRRTWRRRTQSAPRIVATATAVAAILVIP